ncbi:MAG: UDP-N-acetylmuramate--L-alanine ligase [Synergistaceae bacterium]|nr:UDP-N-acetylmuramate--L-alanine ligase [Synergistaceae bacterium]
MLQNIHRLHLMGIGGAGMSALALLLKARGFSVSGCDMKSPHYDLGAIPYELSHSPNHIDTYSPDALILSSAVSRSNPEVVSAVSKNIPIFSRAQALSYMFNQSDGIGIAGAHGKTTTSSMTGLIFLKAGKSPTVYVGANVPDIGTNAVSGSGREFIAELDESDGTFELFTPQIAVITNADWDHVDHYPTREDVIRAFTRFADGRKEGGTLILCAEDEGASQVFGMCDKTRGEILRYGFGKSWDWGAYDITKNHGGGISFRVSHHGREIGLVSLRVSGEHNVLNALAAISAADLRGIDFGASAEILRDFHGSERRMQVKGTASGNILVMDDYAHHPSEIRATLEAVRGIYPERRLVVVYQPHRFTRTAMFAGKIAEALSVAGKAYVLPVYSAGEKECPHSSSEEIIRLGNGKIQSATFDDIGDILRGELHSGDLLLTMGAGDVYSVGEKFLTVNQNV